MGTCDFSISFTCKKSLKFVWKCGCDYFSKCFLCRNALNDIFFILKKLFLRSTHQNDPKYIKKLIFSKKKN
jgi:hypothetical protein